MSILCPSDYCKGRETLHNLCEQIAGDALLYSLFKENAEPVKCPLRGMSLRQRERWPQKGGMYVMYLNRVWFQVLIRLHTIEATASVSILCRISKAAPKIAGCCWVFKHVRMSREQRAQVQSKHFKTLLKHKFIHFNVIVEELTCLATWKDGNSRYLVGLVSHHHAVSNEERYRCFVYEKILPSLGK